MVPAITKTALCSFVAAICLSSGEGTAVTTYDFPTTDFEKYSNDNMHAFLPVGGMFHGICVLGAKDVSTEIKSPPGSFEFNYTSMPFVDGVQAWGDSDFFTMTDIDGNGPEVCEGGTYLQPNISAGPPEKGTDITLRATHENELEGVTICVIFEKPFEWYGKVFDRRGNWVDPLMQDGFTLSEKSPTYYPAPVIGTTESTMYCKHFDPVDPELKCPGDVQLKKTHGEKAFPADAVTIVSQDTSTVTVQLNQAWDATVDKSFYTFYKSVFSNHCYQANDVPVGASLQVTLQCFVTSPTASLRICLQDTGGGLLSAADDATVSKCCESDSPVGTPTVCYDLEIMCETTCAAGEKSRMLRGRI